jgi:hypothetical protein
LGQAQISRHLNNMIRLLLDDGRLSRRSRTSRKPVAEIPADGQAQGPSGDIAPGREQGMSGVGVREIRAPKRVVAFFWRSTKPNAR